MTEMKSLLIELGTEELPVKALPTLAQAFFDGVIEGLGKRGIAFERGDAKPLYSPRRLAVLLPGVADEQPQQTSELLGPYLNIALDVNGDPTKALQGFAQKAGIDWTQLERTTDNKGERFVHRAVKPGQQMHALLPDIVREAIAAMPIPKPMRWSDHDYAFARPVHWLLLLHGDDVIEGEVFGITSDRMSRGHRFMHDKAVWIGRAEDYVDALRGAKVLVDPDERKFKIHEQAQEAAKPFKGFAYTPEWLLEEVNCLVEWPTAIACAFEPEFLAVPREALIATMMQNQKFFPILDRESGGKLTEHFIGIANIESKDDSEIRKGYERVIRPRFADAQFFFVEDMKQGLASMNEGLKTVTYQTKLGTVADKVKRVATLAEIIAAEVGVDPKLARRAAELSKADLQSRLVNEFPELQGIAGRYYAAVENEPLEIANAIDEGYMPRFAGDPIAPSKLGQVIAVAERVDTLASGFAGGLKPTGNKDPFALRRNALGLIRTLIEGQIDVDIRHSLVGAYFFINSEMNFREQFQKVRGEGSYPTILGDNDRFNQLENLIKKFQTDRISFVDHINGASFVNSIYVFVLERLYGYFSERGFSGDQLNAVINVDHANLLDFDRRLKAIGEFAKLPEADALAAANKRIRNILRKVEGDIPSAVDTSFFSEPAERELHDAVELAIVDTDDALARRDYVAALGRLASLRPQVDAFFDGVMVNVDDEKVRDNRLALLKRLSDRLGSVAAIEHLSS